MPSCMQQTTPKCVPNRRRMAKTKQMPSQDIKRETSCKCRLGVFLLLIPTSFGFCQCCDILTMASLTCDFILTVTSLLQLSFWDKIKPMDHRTVHLLDKNVQHHSLCLCWHWRCHLAKLEMVSTFFIQRKFSPIGDCIHLHAHSGS